MKRSQVNVATKSQRKSSLRGTARQKNFRLFLSSLSGLNTPRIVKSTQIGREEQLLYPGAAPFRSSLERLSFQSLPLVLNGRAKPLNLIGGK